MGHRWGIRVGVVVVLCAGMGGGAAFARVRYLPTTAVLPGLALDGERIPDGASAADVRALAERHAAAIASRRVKLAVPGEDKPAFEGTLGDLGVSADVEAAVSTATRYGKEGDPWTRAIAAREARAGHVDVPLAVKVDAVTAAPILAKIKETSDREPVSARLDLDKHATIPEKDGRYIDSDAAIAMLEANARQDGETFTLPVATFAPRISSAFLAKLDIGTVVAEYDTYFGRNGDQRLRGKNIDNATQKLDGLVISPGEMVSFNQVVGERSEANGFYKSWEIFKGEMVEGMGGGTCQVASTFHAASFFGGLDVLERLPHSRPSGYIPMGLDSTVVYPGVDLKVRNPHPFPIVVHAKTEGGKLHIELLGKSHPVDVSFGRELLETIDYKRKIIEDGNLSGKKVLVKQHGIKGFRIRRSRLLKYADGTTKKETTTDTYPPTTEIYHVPVGFDVSLLPALPGDSADPDLGGNPGAAPSAAQTPSTATAAPSTATASADAPASDVEYVNAPGAHTPTAAQKDPAKTFWMKH